MKNIVRRIVLAGAMLVSVATASVAQEAMVPQSREQMQLSFAPVAKMAAPAVVNIYSSRKVAVVARSPLFNDPLFRQFFGGGFGLEQGERTERSLGSGVIIKPDGMIVTSHHVIKDSQQVTVVLSDRREFEATIVLMDERSDLALLKINVGNEELPTLSLRNADTLEVGDLVLAIGNPFGVGQTVTSGIVSALARSTAVGVADYQYFIQTDAAINPGNSGGALVDLEGNLIGVNTAIYSTSGASNGIGFAIPAEMVRSVMASAEQGSERVVRPWLGLEVQAVTPEIAESLGLHVPVGVLVKGVFPDGPSAEAGVLAGDVILSINGYEIVDAQSMNFRAATSPIGSFADVTVRRHGQEQLLKIKMMAPPENPPRDTQTFSGNHPLDQVALANLSLLSAQEIDMPMAERGVVILESLQNRLFKRGDILLEINDKKINAVKDVMAALKDNPRAWRIVFQRGNQVMNLSVR